MKEDEQGNKMRFPEDIIDEKFSREEIDRGIYRAACEFSQIDGVSFIGDALNRLRHNKSIDIFDCGCGTGKVLYELKDQLIFRTQKDGNFTINAVGVNDKDYSRESEYSEVRKAIRNKNIEYLVGKVENINLPKDSFDIIYSYEVLIHNKDTASMIKRMWEFLKENGLLYFNILENQRQDEDFANFIQKIAEKYPVFEHKIIDRHSNDSRIFFKIRKLLKEKI